jgi:hypothetical protein
MDSHEDRVRAVELFIKLGTRQGDHSSAGLPNQERLEGLAPGIRAASRFTGRAFGYPGRGTLTAWVREALPEAKKAIVGRAGRPSYPEALKQAGVIGLCSRQESAQAVAEKLGVCRPTLYNWKNQLLGPRLPHP